MKKIGILTSGGDAPGMNACIRAAVRTSLASGLEVIGIKRGFAGLILGESMTLDREAIANIIHLGGTILGTTRSEEFKDDRQRAKAIQFLRQEGIEGLIIIGGDGTFRGANLLSQESGIQIIGVPGTIDNDIYGTDYSIGFDTAVNTALEAIDRIRDTAMSFQRLFFVEVMGHHTGFIALESGLAGGAEELVIPESSVTIDKLCLHIEDEFQHGKRSIIVVVAEGKNPGDSFRIGEEVRKKTGFDYRVCILGHVQRGGSPSARDRVLASRLGAAGVQALIEARSGYMVGEVNREIVYTFLEDTWAKEKGLHIGLRELAKLLSD